MTIAASLNVYDVLEERGLVAQCTDENIRHRFVRPLVAYSGFDPTADSLHVGSLVPIMGLAHLQRCGHRPIVLVGGATGLVGDPSGKDEARGKLLSREEVDHNTKAIASQIARVVRFDDSSTGAVLVNNADWLTKLSWIDMLRDVGAHFSVNRMLTMDSVRNRLTAADSGISFLEFSYMVMQAYDFLHLYRRFGCTLQTGGQDQWGNIVMGIELGRRLARADLAGLTFPLVTKADGSKFGKSEQGNVWLDARRTGPFAFYQFWRNTADHDVGRFLGYFTFLPVEEVKHLGSLRDQAINEAKEILAYEVTKLVHGEQEADRARDSVRRAFSPKADVTGDAIPSIAITATELTAGIGLVSMIVRAGLAKSNGQARRLVQGGGVCIHDQRITDVGQIVTDRHIQDGYVLIRVGKKRMVRFDVQS